MNKSDVINSLMLCFGVGMNTVMVNEWTFVFDSFTGYYANDGEKFYKSFDDLAGMVDDMFSDGCFND
jgi:hypothetical protein